MKQFYALVANTLAASLANTFVWFAVTFWVYLETKSVIATSVMAGVYLATVAGSGFFLGSLVDRYDKKAVMMLSSALSLLLYLVAGGVYLATPPDTFKDAGSAALWAFVVMALFGAIAGNLRGIALPTLVTLLVPEDSRDRANGVVGSANGVSFLVASLISGVAVGFVGIFWTVVAAVVLTALAMLHLATVRIPAAARGGTAARAAAAGEKAAAADAIDLKGTVAAIAAVPGLFGLIFFNTFNNFLGGVYMALMDAYGLSLMSVQVWGGLWGGLSLGFIVGGLAVAKTGLGPRPLRTLFLANVAMWTISVFFAARSSITLLAVGMFGYLCLIPAVEAAEQTILQKVVPPERQGRVFGFAQSVEQAASPITAFVIGPVAQLFFIPFMSEGGRGAQLIGSWFGTGPDRGLGLLFSVAGVIGLAVTLFAMRSRAYRSLSAYYEGDGDEPAGEPKGEKARNLPLPVLGEGEA